MSITLGGVELNQNLSLDGLVGTADTLSSMDVTLSGNTILQIRPASLSRLLTLIALDSNYKQGWFCHFQIVALKEIANSALPVALVYADETYSVVITDIKVQEWYSWEPINDFKRYSGTISLQEV